MSIKSGKYKKDEVFTIVRVELVEKIPQLVEEYETWRPEMNNGEEYSPILSQQQEEIASSISDTQISALKGKSFYITLAKESPQRIFEDSDESTYDSYHCRETDICRDSTDLDDSDPDSCSSFDAIMEVVEYEVASISGNEALYSNDSSSGGDVNNSISNDFFLTSVAFKNIRQSKNYNSDFADTEDSCSDNYDSELSLADYWKCVKCKNKQNNPMFRYCEKCYQIRKSHFPPRPRKINPKRKRNYQSSPANETIVSTQNSSLNLSGYRQQNIKSEKNNLNQRQSIVNSEHSNEDDKSDTYTEYKHKKLKLSCSTSHNKTLITNNDSISEVTSENSSLETSDTETESTTLNCGGRESRKRKIKGNISYRNENSGVNNYKLRRNALLSSDNESRTSSNEIDDKFINIENKPYLSAIQCNNPENGTQSPCIPLLSQKDSGISSIPSSSQETPSSSSQSDDPRILTNKYSEHDNDHDFLLDKDLHYNLRNFKSNLKNHNVPPQKLLDVSDRNCYGQISSSAKQNNRTSNYSKISLNNNNLTKRNQIYSSSALCKLDSTESIKSSSTTSDNGQCVVCLTEPKNGAFIHTKFAHLCCCYRCAVKIWNTRKKCPICNCPAKNVLKLFVN